jgi:hypothetical protein
LEFCRIDSHYFPSRKVEWNSVPAFAMLRIGAGTIGLLALAEAQKEGVGESTPAQKQPSTSSSARMIWTACMKS